MTQDQLPPLPQLTADRIEHIADLTVKGMPDGIKGFCCTWGWQQFAKALLENFDGEVKAYALAAIEHSRTHVQVSDEPFYGHNFKEVTRGVWRCSCGKQITEGETKCTNGTPNISQPQQDADCLGGIPTLADGSAEHLAQGAFTRADGSHSSVTGTGAPDDPFKAGGLTDLVEHDAILALRPGQATAGQPTMPATEPIKVAPKLIGWRTSDYLMETDDKAKADNWSVHHDMLPIFEGDPHTKLGLRSSTAQASAAPSDGRGTDAQIEKEREIARHAIVGALAAGYAGATHPGADHWLAAAHDAGVRIKTLEGQATAAQPAEQWETSPKDGEQWETSPKSGTQATAAQGEPEDGPEFTVADQDLNYLLNLAADLAKGRANCDTGVAWLEALEAVETRLAAQPTQAAQGEPITVEAVATVQAGPGPDLGARLDWLVEGGIDSLPTGATLLIAHRPITDDDGSGTVYTAAQPAPAVQGEQVAWRELCRRLYVELFCCDQQMTKTLNEDDEPMWTTGSTVRDVLRDALAALEANPAQPAPVVADDGCVNVAVLKAKLRDRACGGALLVKDFHDIIDAAMAAAQKGGAK